MAHDKQSTCHPDRPLYATGLCARCYDRRRYYQGTTCDNCGNRKQRTKSRICLRCYRATLKSRPCSQCGREPRHRGRALCTHCYYLSLKTKRQIIRALSGSIPKCDQIGRKHSSYRGGRLVYCRICDVCVGWRSPSQLRSVIYGHFCKKHTKKSRPKRSINCHCAICGRFTTKRYPKDLSRNHSFRCSVHRYSGRK